MKPEYRRLQPFIAKDRAEFLRTYQRTGWNGYWGDPAKASKAMGKELIDDFVERSLRIAEKALAGEDLTKLPVYPDVLPVSPEAEIIGKKVEEHYAEQTAAVEAWLKKRRSGKRYSEAGGQFRSEDEEAIKKICLERAESFNRHEAPRATDFTSDADFVTAYGMWWKSPAEIASRQGEAMKTVLKDAKLTLLDLRIRFVRPDVAIVHLTHEMSGMLGPDGQKIPPHRERGIRVMVKEQGKWLTTAFHNTRVSDVEASAK